MNVLSELETISKTCYPDFTFFADSGLLYLNGHHYFS